MLFRDFVNNLHPNIKVELKWSKSSIRFLDLDLYICNNSLLYRIGFKDTDSHAILAPTSFHPPHVFRGILFAQVYRWMTRSATYEDFKKTKSVVQGHWRKQGYTRSAIRNAVRGVFHFTLRKPQDFTPGFRPCGQCSVCRFATATRCVVNSVNGVSFPIVHNLTCTDFDVLKGN